MHRSSFIPLTILFGLVLLSSSVTTALGQKRLLKEWDMPSFSEIQIESDEISKVTLQSQASKRVRVFVRLEGEGFENSLISISSTEHVLSIGTDFTPYFQSFNDKLAAHKVLAIEMILMVPEDMYISIRSGSANVFGSGAFKKLHTELESGSVYLDSFKGNATLHSKWGLIKVIAQSGVRANATSSYGKVINSLPSWGTYEIKARTSHGDIELTQTKN